MGGTWRTIANQPSFSIDTMLLLTDASVMCHEYETPNWHRLVPDSTSDYAKGTWHPTAPMPANAPRNQGGPQNAPLYFVSAVLRDGRVLVAGGEYNGGQDVELLAAQIYDPVANTWTSIPTPSGWTSIGDAPSAVLPDGRVLIGDINSSNTAILDPATRHWSAAATKQSSASEEGWTLLPDGTVLAASVDNAPNAEKYVASSNRWVSASHTPAGHGLVSTSSSEIGPAVLMPDGRVFAIGATGHTCLYNPPANPTDPGTWTAGPDFPTDAAHNPLCAPDAPACLLPNGRVLCAVGSLSTSGANSGYAGAPTRFFEYDGTRLTEVPHPPSVNATMTYECRLLVLPTGEALLSTGSSELDLYTPDGTPNPAWAPRIDSAPNALAAGGTYQLTGTQFNGLSQACGYGDDAQMATNYPIVRARHQATGAVSYLRTHDHSTMSVATGARSVSTHFSVGKLPVGSIILTVIANGVESHPIQMSVVSTAYQHVVFLANDGHVHELYDALGAGHWAHNDLTANTGAPAAVAGSPIGCWIDVEARPH
jgi:hypothetical protein